MKVEEKEKKLILAIDVTSKCNLLCPSCPNGNMEQAGLHNRHMSPGKFEKVVRRVCSQMEENGFNKLVIWLYNWTEPLLHPDIADIIRIGKQYASYVAISSNYNFPESKFDLIENMLDAEPSAIKISVSGFSQEVHCIDHAKGNIEWVKNNIEKSVDYIEKKQLEIKRVEVGYHLYNYNLGSEVRNMEQFCDDYRVHFRPYLAYLSPLENLFDCLENKQNDVVTKVQDRLLASPQDIYENMKDIDPVTDRCNLRDGMITLDVDLNVHLCCRTYKQILDCDFFETSIVEMHKIKCSSSFCSKCMGYRQNQLGHPKIMKYFKSLTLRALGGE